MSPLEERQISFAGGTVSSRGDLNRWPAGCIRIVREEEDEDERLAVHRSMFQYPARGPYNELRSPHTLLG